MGYVRDIELWMDGIIDLRCVEIRIITNRDNVIRMLRMDGFKGYKVILNELTLNKKRVN